MKLRYNYLFFIMLSFFAGFSLLSGGCAQIGVISGGPKDTLAPILIKAQPTDKSLNVTGNTITLYFNEYIDVQDLQNNLLVSPLQNRNPNITQNPSSLVIKFKDTLAPNTTYTINFGDAVRDVNENNILKNLVYTFSTGNNLDSLELNGRVTVAETGAVDSTMIVMLYRNAVDSTVQNKKPNYIARVAGDGTFSFKNLPADRFKIYALKDGDGGKTYNSTSELFAFSDSVIDTEKAINDIELFAYAQTKTVSNEVTTTVVNTKVDKRLRAKTNVEVNQDLLSSLEISFNNPLKNIDTNKIYITDTLFKKLPNVLYKLDSTAKIINLNTTWKPNEQLILIIEKDAVQDSANVQLLKNDTIPFATKKTEDYGKLTLIINSLDLTKNPVLQFVVGTDVRYAFPLSSTTFTNSMFTPGDYEIRILYDKDKNGKWTPGNYKEKVQPEKVITLPQKLGVKADWDNEREINL